MNGETDRTTADWFKLIDEQTKLREYVDNTIVLNTLYYEFYLHVCEELEGMESEKE